MPKLTSKCKEKTCKKEIYWIKNKEGGSVPMSIQKDGKWLIHFEDCTNPERFSNRQ